MPFRRSCQAFHVNVFGKIMARSCNHKWNAQKLQQCCLHQTNWLYIIKFSIDNFWFRHTDEELRNRALKPFNFTRKTQDQTPLEQNTNPIETTQHNPLQKQSSSHSDILIKHIQNRLLEKQQDLSASFSLEQAQAENDRLQLQQQKNYSSKSIITKRTGTQSIPTTTESIRNCCSRW